MKRMTTIVLALATAAAFSLGATAAGRASEGAHGGPKATISGELVDMGCYVAHASKGEKHAECALKCVAGGMPMGLLTSKGQLYLMTMDHANADPYNKAKEWAGKQIKVTGAVNTRQGVKTIDVSAAELVATAAKQAG
jgi:type 1 fimbria pilin